MTTFGYCAIGVTLGVICQLYARWRGRKPIEGGAKIISSSLLLVAVFTQPQTDVWPWILAGMAFSWAGDLLMIGQGRRWLAGGLGAFLLAHLFYVVAAVHRIDWAVVPPLGLSIALIAILFAGLVIFEAVWDGLGRLKIPSLFYFSVLGIMTLAAICGWLSDPADRGGQIFVVGAVLFFVSDFAVAVQRFKGPAFKTRLWGLPSYYVGQLLLALSAGYV